MKKDLHDRKNLILNAVIENYITTAEPVSSNIIQKKCQLDLSPATIRNELNELEKEGFLTHLHTSSGRVPTDKGYRLFVNSLMNVKAFPEKQKRIFENKISIIGNNINDVLNQIVDIMSETLDYTTIMLLPDIYNETLKIIHFVLVDMDKVLVVLLNSLGINREFLINLNNQQETKLGQEDLDKLSQFLTKKLEGLNLESLDEKTFLSLIKELPKFHFVLNNLYKELKEFLKKIPKNQRLTIKGTAKMLKLPEFENIEYTRRVLELLEENRLLSSILQNALDKNQTQVMIGSENIDAHLRDCSIVMSSITKEEENVGVLGVLGPTRMAYPYILPLVENIKNNIQKRLENL